MSKYFLEPESSRGQVNVELGLSNYATKIQQVLIHQNFIKTLK